MKWKKVYKKLGKPFGRLLLLCSSLIACEEFNQPDPTPNSGNKQLPQEPANVEAVIDTTDLYLLPKDNGGEQVRFKLGTTEAVFGHFVYTPSSYDPEGPEYPLLLFLHGAGERGNSALNASELNKVLAWGPPKLIHNGEWNPPYPFIVASPQLESGYWRPEDIHEFLNFLIEKYAINTSRIYVTGLSLGGGGTWFYAGENPNHYAAALVPISASGAAHLTQNLKNVPIWAFHGEKDEVVSAFTNFGSAEMVRSINALNPELPAKVTVFPYLAHNAWSVIYGNKVIGTATYKFNRPNLNIYSWMLQYKKDN